MSSSPALRADFPALSTRGRGGEPVIYLDSGATSHRPRRVLEAVARIDERYNGAVKRGSHFLAEKASEEYEGARQAVASFVGVNPESLVFTSGTTQSLNLLAYVFSNCSLGRYESVPHRHLHSPELDPARFIFGPGDEIVTTRAEHHANLIPWQELAARTGATLRWLELDEEGRIDLDSLNIINERTKLVTFTHVSNVTGAISPVNRIVEAAHSVGALTVLDACQSVPHMPVNFSELGVDFAAFSGHKMCGPTGIGALYGKREYLEALPPYQYGGSMVEVVTMEKTTFAEPPARFEAGTMPVAQAVGMGEAARYLSEIGMERIAEHEKNLTARMLTGIQHIPGVRVLGPLSTEHRGGAVSFSVDGVHPHDVGQYLDSHSIAVRVGHHCAQPIHRHFGVFASSRASLGPYSTAHEVDAFLEALSHVRSYFRVDEASE